MQGRWKGQGAAAGGLAIALAAAVVAGAAWHAAVAQDRPGAAPPAGLAGPGGFIVNPTRIVFEGGKRNAQLTVVSQRDVPGTYRVSLVRMRMTEDGAIQEVAEPLPDEQFADTLVRFSPRQAELQPRVPLTIRLQVRLPAGLPAGEYRSHLVVRAVPPPREAVEDSAEPVTGVRIQITPAYGVAIPVIVRQGATEATVSLAGLELRGAGPGDPRQRLALELQRAGNRSVYGNLAVTLVPKSGRPLVVGRANGVAVYTPNAVRRLEVPLELPAGAPLAGGRLDVTFAEPGSRHAAPATASLPLP